MNTYYFLSGDVTVLVDSLITTISHITKVGPVWPLTFRNLNQNGDSRKGRKGLLFKLEFSAVRLSIKI